MENEQKQQEQEIDLIELFYKIIVHWRWFLIAIAVALTGAYIYVPVSYTHLDVYKRQEYSRQ